MKRVFAVLMCSILFLMCFPIIGLAMDDTQPTDTPGPTDTDQSYFFQMQSMDLTQKFDELMKELKLQGFGQKESLVQPEMPGYSLDSVELFQNTYGDMWNNLQLSAPEFPEDFSMSDFMQENSKLRDGIFSDVKGSEEYKSVMEKLNVGSIWEKAARGLPSAENLLSNSFESDFNKADEESEGNKSKQAQLQEDTLKLFTESGKLLSESSKDSFWNAVKDVKDIISADGEMGDIFDKFK